MSVQPQSHSAKPLQVFLCHAAVDKPEVKKLGQWLHNEGFNPWLDEEDLLPGQTREQEIKQAIRAASVVLICLSYSSISQDGYVHKEIDLALDVAKEKPDGSIFLIPVRLAECELPERLYHLHPVNLFEERGYEGLRKALQYRIAQLKTTPNVRGALQDIRGVTRPKQQSDVVPPGFSKRVPPDPSRQHVVPETEPTTTAQETLEPVAALIDIAPPAGVVFMHVQAYGSMACSVLLSSGTAGELLNIEILDCSSIKPLGEIVHANSRFNQPLRDILNYMREFSRSEKEMRLHLRKLHEQYTMQGYLMICDYTDFEIPWEMFCLHLKRNEYLGTAFTTARWQRVINEDNLEDLSVDVKVEECTGNIVSYVNRAELAEARDEINWLQTLNAHIYHDIHHFRHHLEKHDLGFGLVYIASHGIFGDDMHQVILGVQQNGQQQLRLLDMATWQLNLLHASKGIVFLNACHSGRLKDFNKANYRKGFAEIFLWQGARGVIGTLGGVGDKHAAYIGENLLRNCYENSEKSVATLLRELRQEAVERIKDNPTDEAWLQFIYTFMYIYYGNPMTVLRLTKREG